MSGVMARKQRSELITLLVALLRYCIIYMAVGPLSGAFQGLELGGCQDEQSNAPPIVPHIQGTHLQRMGP
jgi:hypothetical protein